MRVLTLLFLFLLTAGLSAQMVGDKQTGLASYYSGEYDGAETAYGVTYNKNELVAGHKAYPLNSTVRILNNQNGRSVVVRIIDKGPFIRGRIIEVSERAAADLGMLGERTTPVEITLLSTPSQPASRTLQEVEIVREPVTATPVERPTRPADEAPTATPSMAQREVEAPPSTTIEVAPAPRANTTPAAPPASTVANRQVKQVAVRSEDYVKSSSFGPGLYKVNLLEPPVGQFGVQVGSFSTLESAMDQVVQMQNKYFDNVLIFRVGSTLPSTTYKVILGPFVDLPSARNYASDLKSRYKINGFTVDLGEEGRRP